MRYLLFILTFFYCVDTPCASVNKQQQGHMVLQNLHHNLDEWFQNQPNQSYYEEYDFSIHAINKKLQLFDQAKSYKIKSFDYSPSTYQFYAIYIYQDDGNKETEIHINGRAFPLISIPVLNSKVLPGKIIQSSNLIMQKIRVNQIQRNYVTKIKDLVGMIARSNLNEFKPISKYQIKLPLLVEKNKLVTMKLKTNYLEMAVRGKALSNGAKGDIIPIMNLKSKKIIEGEVIGHQLVNIQGVESVT